MKNIINMKSIISVFVAFIMLLSTNNVDAQPANFEWVKQISATGVEIPPSTTLDRVGNVYTTGQFFGTVDFDPGKGMYNLTADGLFDVFISKLDPSGNLIWAKRFGGPGYDGGYSIAVDSIGNVYTTGIFNDSVDFDPGVAEYTLTYKGNDDIFISKLDPLGNFIWARRIGEIGQEFSLSIAVDSQGSVYTTGLFDTKVDFDPGPDTYWLKGVGSEILFISKLDSSGNFVWAKSLDGKNHNLEMGYSLKIDVYDNLYITGSFAGSLDFDMGPDIFTMQAYGVDVFILKLSSSGEFLWARNIGGRYINRGHSISIDNSGNVYTAGFFTGIADLVPGDGYTLFHSKGEYDIFLTKLDSLGTFIWSKQFGDSLFDMAYSVAVDKNGHIYMTGSFQGSIDFDPTEKTALLSAKGEYDAFILKLNRDGELLWAKKIGGNSFDNGYSINVDNSDNIYTTGTFEGSVDFDPNIGISRLTADNSNTYILKMNQTPVGIAEELLSEKLSVYPNPTPGIFTIDIPAVQFEKRADIVIYTLDGTVIKKYPEVETQKLHVDLSTEPIGNYIIEIQVGSKKRMMKVTVIK